MKRILPLQTIVPIKSDFTKLTLKRIIGIYGIILSLLADRAQGTVILFEVWVDDTKIIPTNPKQTDNLYEIGAKTFKINFQPINLAGNPITLDISFEDSTNQEKYTYSTKLEAQQVELSNVTSYDPKNGTLKSFVDNLLKDTYLGHKVWTSEEDIQVVGNSIKLVFSEIKKLIRFYEKSSAVAWDTMVDEKLHQTRILLPYGFDGEGASNNCTLYKIKHQPESSDLKKDIWYLDGARKLVEVREIKYRTVPENMEDWRTQNNFPLAFYKEIVPGTECKNSDQIFVLNPPKTPNRVELDPRNKNVLGKYYKREKELKLDQGKIIFFDGKDVCQTNHNEWECFEQKVTKNGIDFAFSNAETVPCYISTIRSTKNVLRRPPLGTTGGVQFVQLGKDFEVGFYDYTSNIHGGVTQVWNHLETNSGSVSISISGIKNNDKWLPLKALPKIQPETMGNQLVIDLTPAIGEISGSQWDELENYLIAAYWLTQEEPIFKCTFPDSPKNPGELSEKVSELLNNTNCLKISFNYGCFLTLDRSGSWSLMGCNDYEKRGRNDGSSCKIALYGGSVIKTLLKDVPNHSQLDLTNYVLPRCNTLLNCIIADHPFQTILLKELDKAECDKLKYSETDMMKLLLKVGGLKTLRLAHMKGLKNWDLPKILRHNGDTIVHLDLTGSEINSSQRNDFIKVVGQIKNLESLKIIKTAFSNDQTVELARVLEGKSSLTRLELSMPYNLLLGAELIANFSQHMWAEANTPKGKANLVGQVVISPLTTSCTLAILALYEGIVYRNDQINILFPGISKYGLSFSDAYYSLTRVPNLQNLKLQVSNLTKNEDILRTEFNKTRELNKLGFTKIEFYK